MTYNFKRKGFVRQAVTQQGDGFIISEQTKVIDNATLNMVHGNTRATIMTIRTFILTFQSGKTRKYVVMG